MVKDYRFDFYNISELLEIINEVFPNYLTLQQKYDIRNYLRSIPKKLIIKVRDELMKQSNDDSLDILSSANLLVKANGFYNSAILFNFERDVL